MKKLELTKMIIAAVVIVGAFTLASCGGKKKATKSVLGTEIELPCNDVDYHSTKTHFRGTGQGESTNQSMSKKSQYDAKANLAAELIGTIKTVSDRYRQILRW